MDSRRREERTEASVPVRIWGMDANSKPFTVTATTHDITRYGVRLMGIRVPLGVGEIVGLQHGNEKARFRVAWCGRPGSRLEANVGLQALDWKKHIWGDLVRDSEPTLMTNAAGANQGGAQPPPLTPQATQRFAAAERRLATRYVCHFPVSVSDPQSDSTIEAKLREMSLIGCFVETPEDVPREAALNVVVRGSNGEIPLVARVRFFEEGAGFGLRFVQLSDTARERLESTIERLAKEATKTQAALMAERTIGSRSEGISAAVYQLTTQLRELERLASQHKTDLHPGLIKALSTHSDQARRAAFAIQQWLEFRDQGKDATPILTELEDRRIRANIAAIKELLAETEGESFTMENPAVAELYSAAAQVYRRLAWLDERKRPTSAKS